MDKIQRFLEELTIWASAQSDIQALALVGSHARGAAKEKSDVDLVLITATPRRYLENTDWTEQFGSVEKRQTEDYGALTSLRVWYADGREIEYGITDEKWAAIPLDEGSRRVISDGMKVLFERERILSRHQ
ncbi:MAG: nucleotidyltransferase domain-containing protein [Chloroflexi bacterium]|nr:nucleotidyltransferase domain-containing protein [Chloroflexota bacterium]